MPFGPELENNFFRGEFTKFEVIDPVAKGHRPNLVVNGKRDFEIELVWKFTGTRIADIIHDTAENWSVEAYADPVGPGTGRQIASATLSKGTQDTWVDGLEYSRVLTVPANTLQEGDPNQPLGPSGVYRLLCTCFLNGKPGLPGRHDIAGFTGEVLIRVEDLA